MPLKTSDSDPESDLISPNFDHVAHARAINELRASQRAHETNVKNFDSTIIRSQNQVLTARNLLRECQQALREAEQDLERAADAERNVRAKQRDEMRVFKTRSAEHKRRNKQLRHADLERAWWIAADLDMEKASQEAEKPAAPTKMEE